MKKQITAFKPAFLALILVILTLGSASAQVFVDPGATGNEDGTSWMDAFTDLQNAIDEAELTATSASPTQVWVKEGFYFPTQGSGTALSFTLKNNVELYGGFRGTESLLSERDPSVYETILSANIGNPTDSLDNSNFILGIGSIVSDRVLVDGFILEGVYSPSSTGGAVYYGSSPNQVEFNNCIFRNNYSPIGSAIATGNGSATSILIVANCQFINNGSAASVSGAIFARTDTRIYNSVFIKNKSNNGAGVNIFTGSAEIANCTFFGNEGTAGTAINFQGNSTGSISNNILWGNTGSSELQLTTGATATVSNNLIEGGFTGSTNTLDIDPNFADEANFDLSLPQCSPAVDQGDNALLNPAVTEDILGNSRIFNGTVDLGAYENQVAPLFFSAVEIQDALCNGGATGQISVNGAGGSGTVEYSIDGTNFSNNSIFTGLAAGTYTITLRDTGNGCTYSEPYTVSEPDPLSVSFTTSDALCNGDFNGAIDVTASGGSTPYTLFISGTNFGQFTSTTNFSLLSANSYSILVQDANGCSFSSSFTIGQPAVLSATATTTDVLCAGENTGEINVSATGGTTPYEYSVDGTNFQASNVLDELGAGSYTVTIRDANNCTTTLMETLTEPSALGIIAISASNVTCNGGNDGSFSFDGSGGTTPYQYSLDGVTFQSSPLWENQTAGNYTITIQDANGCETTANWTVTEPDAIAGTITTTGTSSCGLSDGQLDLTATGGTAPYAYSLDGGTTTQATGSFAGLSAGAYTITVIDDNGCIETFMESVDDPVTATIAVSNTDVLCNGNANGSITVDVTGGTNPISFALNGGTPQSGNVFDNLTAGVYTVDVIEGNGCTQSVNVTVDEPDETKTPGLPASVTTTYGANVPASTLVITADITDAVVTHYQISAISNGSLFLSDGMTSVTNGTFITKSDGDAGLIFVPLAAGVGGFSVQSAASNQASCLSGSIASITITVEQTPLSITADDQSKVYGEANPTLTISYAGFVNGEDASALTMAPSITTTATTSSVVGTYPIAVSGATSDNYDITYSNGTLTITQASLTATANDQMITFGDALPSLDGTLSGVVNGDNITASYATTASASSGAGTYPITVSLNDPDTRLGNYSTTLTDGTLTISKADQVITFGTIADIDLATANTVSLTATADSGLSITYTLDQGDGSISGTTLTVNTTGNFTVTASQDGDDDYNAASSVSQSFQVVDSRKTDQTITFTQDLTGKTYGEAPFTLTATASSQLAVSYSSTGPVSIGNGEVTILGAGEATITAEQAGDGTYNPATSVTQTFTIGQASLTATADDATITFGDALPMYTVSYAGFVGSDDASDLDTPPTATSAATSSSDAGMYAIVASGGQDDNYTFTYVDGTLTINKADQTITFGTIADIDIANTTQVTLTATADSGLPITYTLDQGDGSISGTTLTVNNTGNFMVTATQAGTTNYTAATPVSQTFAVTDSRKQDQTITFASIADQEYGEALTLNATASSNLAVSYTLVDGVGTLSNGVLTIEGVGSYELRATQDGDTDYNPAPAVTQQFMVSKAPLTATADDETINEGDALPTLTISYTGFKLSDDATTLDTAPTVSTEATTTSGPGSYALTVTGGDDANYAFTLVDGVLTIAQVLGIGTPVVEVYPNPATDRLTIQGVSYEWLTLSDLSGREVLRTSERVLELGDLPKTVYVLRLEMEGRTIHQQKIKIN